MPIHPIAVVDRVIEEYRDYLLTEFRAKDESLRDELKRALQAQGFLAQEPFFQAHRPFKEGKPWRALGLDERLAKVLEKRSGSKTAFLHQSEAITHLLGPKATPLAVTTGTGSGKTECFLVPVLQNAIEDASRFRRDGLTAILVYPMNALATDQENRIQEYLEGSGHASVRVERYDRTTSQAKRDEMRRKPPHVLLTNYMMLEYLLVRPKDREALFKNHRCRFIVLDEVHTYRGSLGANIALLFRRLREHLRNAQQDWAVENQDDTQRFPKPIIVATSATIKSVEESRTRGEEDRRSLREAAVQDFLKTITGFPPHVFKVLGEERQPLAVPPEAVWPTEPVVIDEPKHGDAEGVRRAIARLAGLSEDTPVEKAARSAKILYTLGDVLSQRPLPLSGIVDAVLRDAPERQGKPREFVEKEVRAALSAGISLGDVNGALRLRAHRFLRGGWRFSRCIDPACGALHARGETTCATCGKTAAPLLLCRACGMEALHFRGEADPTKGKLEPYSMEEDGEEWVLYDQRKIDTTEDEDDGDVVEPPKRGQKGKPQMKDRPILRGSFEPVTSTFDENETMFPVPVVLAPARSRCLSCGNDARSGTLLTGVSLGTSAAVRVLAEGVVESLAEQHKAQPEGDGKERVLIFADSRQDAAHQAQFIEEAGRYDRMRRRMCRVLAEKGSCTIDEVLGEMLNLAFQHKDNPSVKGKERSVKVLGRQQEEEALAWEEAPLLDDLAVRSHFRATVFNLGLVGVRYGELDAAIESFRCRITISRLARATPGVATAPAIISSGFS